MSDSRAEAHCCGNPTDLAGVSRRYRRALAAVVVLNLGMGTAEVVGGFLAASHSLKADALDFLGDGLVTLFAFVALRRGAIWRARAALLQGLFLGFLGICVIGAALYRAVFPRMPEASVMGALGVAALATNILAAFLLVPHRHGDASARSVWQFSRNDAIGNMAVVIAAALTRWTATAWPDLVAALAIAGLFFASTFQIVRGARGELRGLRKRLQDRP